MTRRSGSVGATRSARLPQALDAWFEERLSLQRDRSPSELLIQLIHGGLRLREGYMPIHKNALERFRMQNDQSAFATYRACLLDTFGHEYVQHLEQWLEADGFSMSTT